MANPVLWAVLASFVRHFVSMAAGYLVAHGVWAHEDSDKYVVEITAAIVAGLAVLGASAWNKYKQKRLVNTLAAMPEGSTVAEARKVIAEGQAPPATLPETASPYLNTPESTRKIHSEVVNHDRVKIPTHTVPGYRPVVTEPVQKATPHPLPPFED